MRGQKSSTEEKRLKGTLNPTREKRKTELTNNTNIEVSSYLNKTKEMLDVLWIKINDQSIQDDIDKFEKYSKLFILWQKHYFSHLSYAPKQIEGEDIISQLINEKEL